MQDLEHLNALRAELNMKPLKSWKASKQALADTIATLEEAVKRERASSTDDKRAFNDDWSLKTKSPVEAKSTKKAGPNPQAKPKNKNASPADFAKFLSDNNIDPRVARAKLRRHKLKAPYILDEKTKHILTTDARKVKS